MQLEQEPDAKMTEGTALIPIDPDAVSAARAAALTDDHLLLIVETFQALADPTRARILYALIQRPLCVRDLAILVGVSPSAISHQLRFLRERHLERPDPTCARFQRAVDPCCTMAMAVAKGEQFP